jgi:type VI secretion system secreted protein Hcp
MALNVYMTLKGQKQGPINGSVTQRGRENSILVHAVSHSIATPRDAASGLPTGKRMHRPFVVTKEIDKSSPLLYQALTTNENLTTCQFLYYATAPGAAEGAGLERQIYTITLTNANIAEIDQRMANNLEAGMANMPVLEVVSFTYQKIQWTWADGSVTSSDNWEAPTV